MRYVWLRRLNDVINIYDSFDIPPGGLISNGVAPDGTLVAYGTTTFNLFLFDPGNLSNTYLGSTSTLAVTVIPAPAGLVVFALAPVRRRRRRGA